MTLPTTYVAALVLTALSSLCLGSWANCLKLTRKWRFELFYLDFAIGLLLAAVVAAFTLGTLGSDGFVLLDDLMRAGKRNMACALGAGVIFNLGNMLLVAAVTLLGLSVAFPLSLGLALVIGVIFSNIAKPQGNPMLVFTGVGLVVLAVMAGVFTHRSRALHRELQKMKAGEHRTLRPSVSWKGVLLGAVGGVILGLFFPLLDMARAEDTGLGPYSTGLLFCAGVFFSTLVYNLYFMNLPVQGPPVEILQYFRSRSRYHLFGILGGIIWCTGLIGSYVAAGAPAEEQGSPGINFAILQAAPLVAALWGLLVWKESKATNAKVHALTVLMLFLFAAGLATLAVAGFSLTS